MFSIKKNSSSQSSSDKVFQMSGIGLESAVLHLPTEVFICNPSIIFKDGSFKAIVRGLLPFNYKTANENSPTSENWIVEFDLSLKVTHKQKIEDLSVREGLPEAKLGLEDGRLFVWKNQEWILFSGFSKDEEGPRNSMVICRLEGNELKDAELLRSPFRHPREKNWMPWVVDGNLYFVYSSAPLEVFQYIGNGKLQRISHPKPSYASKLLRRFKPRSIMSGSSQVIPWGKDYLAVIHNREQMYPFGRLWMKFISQDKDYQVKKVLFRHRIILFGSDFSIKAVSKPFKFELDGVEFCAGMVEKEGMLYLSYGLLDRQAKILKIDIDVLLKNMGLPFLSSLQLGH